MSRSARKTLTACVPSSCSSEFEELGETEFLPGRRLSFSQRLLSSLSLGGRGSGGSQEILTSPQRLSRERSLAEPAPGRILYSASSATPGVAMSGGASADLVEAKHSSASDIALQLAPTRPTGHLQHQLSLPLHHYEQSMRFHHSSDSSGEHTGPSTISATLAAPPSPASAPSATPPHSPEAGNYRLVTSPIPRETEINIVQYLRHSLSAGHSASR